LPRPTSPRSPSSHGSSAGRPLRTAVESGVFAVGDSAPRTPVWNLSPSQGGDSATFRRRSARLRFCSVPGRDGVLELVVATMAGGDSCRQRPHSESWRRLLSMTGKKVVGHAQPHTKSSLQISPGCRFLPRGFPTQHALALGKSWLLEVVQVFPGRVSDSPTSGGINRRGRPVLCQASSPCTLDSNPGLESILLQNLPCPSPVIHHRRPSWLAALMP